MNGLYKVRLTATVAADGSADVPAKVVVSKIEILDPRDESVVQKVIE